MTGHELLKAPPHTAVENHVACWSLDSSVYKVHEARVRGPALYAEE